MMLPMPFLSKLHTRFREVTKMRSVDAMPVAEADAFKERCSRVNIYSHSKKQTDLMEQLLEDLWIHIVKPILDHLLHGQASQQNIKEESKAWQIPDQDKRQRLWWCCQGDFSFLPLHAAGIYHGDSPICISDFFISSYTPTLGALIDARNRPLPHELKVLAAAQPDAGSTKLMKVGEELKVIEQIVPPQNLIYLNNDRHLDLEGKHTSVETVLTKLPEASVLHLACHGTQDANNPLRSGFLLERGKRLTIHKLVQYRYPNAFMAILSACHTASNDAEQPEEVMNIASALMFLGFGTILGTKWPMSDLDGPIVAKFVYNALFNQQITPEALKQTSPWVMERLFGDHLMKLKTFSSESDPGYAEAFQELTKDHIAARTEGSARTLATFSLARVVDDLAREMRRNKVPAERWATFVHIGV
ncbi:hypothetical protein NLI96_g6852 [Meripilus lineatus]|uniref:CHAT domain-containing protein n=1 Tax=Meripilus lineatus TaxID=2056292 RepID=A0AAD5YHQ8_9APHY|nr:hypothetical protein NLI96_g6852 [Physisporinus lineatus]